MKKIKNYFVGNVIMGVLQIWVTVALIFTLFVGAHHFINRLNIF